MLGEPGSRLRRGYRECCGRRRKLVLRCRRRFRRAGLELAEFIEARALLTPREEQALEGRAPVPRAT